ncbi:P-loop NTPase fold protein [Methanolobus sp. WCC1]|uniref:P-loop NTPase fold protein n=1 Tax=unclassified Methanolobus TaxID=2629569 RepID=UPI0032463394
MTDMETKNYDFNLLEDEVVDTDFFEDKTHENVAKTLYKLIKNNDRGFTIGVEGSWGSGKSTVISILKRKIEEEPELFHYFYFDAWAHEGDHLRRIFLESFISQLNTKSQKLKDLEKEISNRKRTTETTTKQYGTTLGKLLAGAVLFVPLGAGLVSGADTLQLSLNLNGNIQWIFLLGAALSLMPLWVLAGYAIHLKKRDKITWKVIFKDKGKCIFKDENWAFLESNSDIITTQEISEEEERSSVEFERYFANILTEIFHEKNNSKLLIVVDNLDRIDAEDSLKIWSTLQTFLQQRNPTKSDCDFYKNIWIIVPYDMYGLSKLWENGRILEAGSPEPNLGACAKSFFGKCFQIRVEVPEPIFTGWEKFTNEMLNLAFETWDSSEKENVLEVLKLTRENLTDTPTPREIKNYINQVGILKLHVSNEIPVKSIAYYAMYKYIKGFSTQSIKTMLINAELPIFKDKDFLPPECNKHMAGIIYGVKPDKGHQLLLEPEIEKALLNAAGSELTHLVEVHKEGFWPVFDYHINNTTVTSDSFNYSKAVYSGLWEEEKTHCGKFILKIKEGFSKNIPSLPKDGNIEDYLPIIKMSTDTVFLENIWNIVLTTLESKIEEEENFSFEDNVKFLKNIAENLGDITKAYTSSKISVDNWIKWAQAAKTEGINAYLWLIPSKVISKEIKTANGTVLSGTKELLSYCIHSGITGWEELANVCEKHLSQNNGSINDETSKEIPDILLLLTTHDKASRTVIEMILRNGQFHNFVHTQQNTEVKLSSALLMAHYFGNELHDIKIVPPIVNSENGLQSMRAIWLTNDKANAIEMLRLLNEYDQLNLVWDMAEKKENQLVIAIIELALEEDISELFTCTEVLEKLQFAIEIIKDSDMQDKIVAQFLKHSAIEKEVKITSNLDVFKYSEALLAILRKSKNNDMIRILTILIRKVDKDKWDTCFIDNRNPILLALELKNKKSDFSLENTYLDALFDFAQQWSKDENRADDWQKGKWISLVNLLGESFQKRYKDKLTKLLLDADFIVTKEFCECNHSFLNYHTLLINEKAKLQTSFADAIEENGNFDCLEIIDIILRNDENESFIPDDYISKTESEPLINMYEAQDDENRKEVLKRLAHKFNIKLIEQNSESQEEIE